MPSQAQMAHVYLSLKFSYIYLYVIPSFKPFSFTVLRFQPLSLLDRFQQSRLIRCRKLPNLGTFAWRKHPRRSCFSSYKHRCVYSALLYVWPKLLTIDRHVSFTLLPLTSPIDLMIFETSILCSNEKLSKRKSFWKNKERKKSISDSQFMLSNFR